MRSVNDEVKQRRIPYQHFCTSEGADAISRDTLVRHAKAQLMDALPHFHPVTIRAVIDDLLEGRVIPTSPVDCLLGRLSQHEWCVGTDLGACSGVFGWGGHVHCIEKGMRELGYSFDGDSYLEQYL